MTRCSATASSARPSSSPSPGCPCPNGLPVLRIGGPVTLESLLYAVYDALRLAAILACLGAANALASPRRLLRYLPATLYDVGTAVVVGLTFAPQLLTDARAVRAARTLRGHDGHAACARLARLAVPVLETAFERSLGLAASMESRGYGRAVRVDPRRRGAPPPGSRSSGSSASSPASTACSTPRPAACSGCRCSSSGRCSRPPASSSAPRATRARATAATGGRGPRPSPSSAGAAARGRPRRRLRAGLGGRRPDASSADLPAAARSSPSLAVLVAALPAWLTPRPREVDR